MDTTNMTGHNSGLGTVTHQLNSAIAVLGLLLQDELIDSKHRRENMVKIARALVAVDQLAANDEALADAEIRKAGIVAPANLIAAVNERVYARWLARGGVLSGTRRVEYPYSPKNINEVNDLEGGLNDVEGRFLTGKKFAKVTSYSGVYYGFAREAKVEIRKAFDSVDNREPLLASVRDTYVDMLFQADTVEGWIAEEEYRRSDEYRKKQELKQAWALRIEEAIEDAKNDPLALERLEAQVKKQLAQIRELAAQKRAEAEARKALAGVSPTQRKLVEDSLRRGAESDDDDDLALGDGT